MQKGALFVQTLAVFGEEVTLRHLRHVVFVEEFTVIAYDAL